MHQLFSVLVFVLCFTSACDSRKIAAEKRYRAGMIRVSQGYTNADIRVAERALRDHRTFLMEEAEVNGMAGYEYAYAVTTERQARICEFRGKADQAAALRAELTSFIVKVNKQFTMQEISDTVTKLDEAYGIGTSTWHYVSSTTNAASAVDGGNPDEKK